MQTIENSKESLRITAMIKGSYLSKVYLCYRSLHVHVRIILDEFDNIENFLHRIDPLNPLCRYLHTYIFQEIRNWSIVCIPVGL